LISPGGEFGNWEEAFPPLDVLSLGAKGVPPLFTGSGPPQCVRGWPPCGCGVWLTGAVGSATGGNSVAVSCSVGTICPAKVGEAVLEGAEFTGGEPPTPVPLSEVGTLVPPSGAGPII
jgi:hypothetical protein